MRCLLWAALVVPCALLPSSCHAADGGVCGETGEAATSLLQHARALELDVEWYDKLPKFETSEELEAEAGWKQYLDDVYGIDTVTFPFDLKWLQLFYINHLPEEWVPANEIPFWHAAMSEPMQKMLFIQLYRHAGGQRYTKFMAYGFPVPDPADPSHKPDESSIQSEGMFNAGKAFEDNNKVEVDHKYCLGDGSEWWMFYAPGSGVWYDLGRTVAFQDHADMHSVASTYEELREQGYDSVQFTMHYEDCCDPENGNQVDGGNAVGLYMFEIVDLSRYDASADPKFQSCPRKAAADRFFSGWMGVNPCTCDPNRLYLNCGMTANKDGDFCKDSGSEHRCVDGPLSMMPWPSPEDCPGASECYDGCTDPW